MTIRKTTLQQTNLDNFNKNNQRLQPSSVSPDIIEFRMTMIDVENGGDLESISLSGTDLPHQPFTSPVGNEITKEYYPGGQGNRKPVIQVLGSYDDNVVLNGRFKATKVRDPAQEKAPIEKSDRLKRFAYSGNPIRFELGNWIKYGYIQNYSAIYKNDSDLDYSIDILIFGDDNPINNPVIPKAIIAPTQDLTSDRGDIQAQVALAIEDIKNANEDDTLPDFDIEAFNRQEFGVNEYVADLQDAPRGTPLQERTVRFLDTILTGAEQVSESIDDSINDVLEAADSSPVLQDVLVVRKRLTDIKRSVSNSYDLATNFNSKRRIGAYNTLNSILNFANSVDIKLKGMEDRLQLARLRDIRRTYIVKASDTLQSISVMFFGNYNSWEDIRRVNSLASTNLIEGQELVIPV